MVFADDSACGSLPQVGPLSQQQNSLWCAATAVTSAEQSEVHKVCLTLVAAQSSQLATWLWLSLHSCTDVNVQQSVPVHMVPA